MMRTHRSLTLLSLLTAACGAPDQDVVLDDSGVTIEETTLVQDLVLDLSPEHATVVSVSWTSPEPTVGWVEFGLEGDAPQATQLDDEPCTEHRFTLLGLLPSSSYGVEIFNQPDVGSAQSTHASVETGPIDDFGVNITVTQVDTSRGAGGFNLLPIRGDSVDNHLAILDNEGRHVWSHLLDDVVFTRARLSADQRSVLYNTMVSHPEDEGSVVRLSLDGSEHEVTMVPGAFLDFVEVEPGRYAALAVEVLDVGDGRLLLDEIILEVAPGEEPERVWSAAETLGFDLDQSYATSTFGEDYEQPWHLNSLSYDASEDTFYVTSLIEIAVYKIHRGSGELDWTLSPRAGDFAGVPNAGALNFLPHSALPTANGVLIFDRGSRSQSGCSAAVEYDLNLDAMTAERAWEYYTEDCQVSGMLGNAQPLWNGNRLLVLAMNGQIDEVSSEGELLWRLNLDFGKEARFSERFESFYR